MENELIDFVLIRQRSDDAAVRHPNIFAWLQAQSLGQSLDRLADEFGGWRENL